MRLSKQQLRERALSRPDLQNDIVRAEFSGFETATQDFRIGQEILPKTYSVVEKRRHDGNLTGIKKADANASA